MSLKTPVTDKDSPQARLGRLLKDRRLAKLKTQDDLAEALQMSRANYSHMESGRRLDPLTPDQANTICEELEIEMLELLVTLGYKLPMPKGIRNPAELRHMEAFRRAAPSVQEHIDKGLGL